MHLIWFATNSNMNVDNFKQKQNGDVPIDLSVLCSVSL